MNSYSFLYLIISFIVATIAAQLWTEGQFLSGSKMSCRWYANKPCSVKVHFHLYLMLATRFAALANTSSLLYLIYRTTYSYEIIDFIVVFPTTLIIVLIVLIGVAYKHWSKQINGH